MVIGKCERKRFGIGAVGFVRPCDTKYTTGVVSVSERFAGTAYEAVRVKWIGTRWTTESNPRERKTATERRYDGRPSEVDKHTMNDRVKPARAEIDAGTAIRT